MPPLSSSAQRMHRAPAVALRLGMLLACGLASVQLAGCADQLPLAPSERQSATMPLPSAARYIIELGTDGAVSPAVGEAVRSVGGRIIRTAPDLGIALVTGLSRDAAESLRSMSGIRLVLPDVSRQFVHPSELSRRFFVQQHAAARGTIGITAADPGSAYFFSSQWNIRQVRADSAWRVTNQGAGARVFILDTGIDDKHIDLVGRVDTASSTSFAFASDQDTVPLPFDHDVVGHGTFVASLIVSNGLGIAAVAPQARVAMVRVLNDEGAGDDFAVISGVVYAADEGADVINMSLGGYLNRTNAFDLAIRDLFQRAVDYATARGTLVVGAAGNESLNSTTATGPDGSYADSMHTPAGGLLHVLSVGATGPVAQQKFDQIATYSNFGSADVAVFAPGGNTVDTTSAVDLVMGACSTAASPSCAGENYYFYGAGTSFAAPMVAAEAAVIKANATKKPTPAELESCVLKTAFEVNGKRPDPDYGFGRIDVLKGAKGSSCK